LASEIKDLFSLIKGGIEFFQRRKETKLEKQRIFFEKHIEPVFLKLEQIHKDYTDSFSKLARYMSNQELPPQELVEWLQDRRHKLESERIDVKNFKQELYSSNFYKLAKDSEVGAALLEFVEAIKKFFYTPQNMYEVSFYRRFEGELESSIYALKQHPDPKTRKIAAKMFYEAAEVKDTFTILENVVNKYLPRNWNQVSFSYRRLRGPPKLESLKLTEPPSGYCALNRDAMSDF
jgi:hypothetical protein